MQARLRENPTLNLSGLKEVNGADNRFNVGGSLPLELFGRRTQMVEESAFSIGADEADSG